MELVPLVNTMEDFDCIVSGTDMDPMANDSDDDEEDWGIASREDAFLESIFDFEAFKAAKDGETLVSREVTLVPGSMDPNPVDLLK